MTPCPTEIEKWDFLNGGMDPKEAAAFAMHLEECPACRAEIAGLKDIASGLERLSLPDAPVALTETVKKTLARDAGSAPGKKVRDFRWINLAAGGILVLAAVALTLIFPVKIPMESIAEFFKTPSEPALSESAREILGKILAFLPLVLVPSIIENIRFLVRRRHKRPTIHLRLFSI